MLSIFAFTYLLARDVLHDMFLHAFSLFSNWVVYLLYLETLCSLDDGYYQIHGLQIFSLYIAPFLLSRIVYQIKRLYFNLYY